MTNRLIALALPIALSGVSLALLVVVGARLRLLPPLAAFGLFTLSILGGSALALVLGGWGVVSGGDARGAAVAAALLGLAGIGLLAILAWGARGAPPIHDITTDPADPPAFVAATSYDANAGRDMSYPNGAPDTAAQQRDAYPDLAPIALDEPPEEAFAAASRAAEYLGWVFSERDPASGVFEATDETSVFRFVDDIVVRVRPADGGSVVDVRSLSRLGVSDLGANAARIRAFRDVLLTDRR